MQLTLPSPGPPSGSSGSAAGSRGSPPVPGPGPSLLAASESRPGAATRTWTAGLVHIGMLGSKMATGFSAIAKGQEVFSCCINLTSIPQVAGRLLPVQPLCKSCDSSGGDGVSWGTLQTLNSCCTSGQRSPSFYQGHLFLYYVLFS